MTERTVNRRLDVEALRSLPVPVKVGAGRERPLCRRADFLRTVWLLCASTLFFGAESLQAAEVDGEEKLKKPPTTWHATAYVRGSMGIRVIDYWSRGSSMRARTLIGGHPILTLVDEGRYISIDQLTGRGVSIRRPASAIAGDAKRVRPFGFEMEELVRDGGEKIEEMEIGGMAAEIWQVRDALGRRKIWTSASVPRVPLRIETFSRAASETIQLDYSNWIFDVDYPAAFFKPPTGVQLEVVEYDVFSQKSAEGTVTPVPILYPDLLHGLVVD